MEPKVDKKDPLYHSWKTINLIICFNFGTIFVPNLKQKIIFAFTDINILLSYFSILYESKPLNDFRGFGEFKDLAGFGGKYHSKTFG